MMAPDHPYLNTALQCLKELEQAGYEARLAGGCVRDRLLGLPPKDFDIATNATPSQTKNLFESKGYTVIATGEAFGTMSVVFRCGAIEITTLRKDVLTDGRHATVVFGHSFEEDAERRDFTVNAMFEDRHGRLFDFFGGTADLKRGYLRFVGVADQRIQEDYLRMMRFFRFWVRFGFTPDQEALAAIKTHSTGLRRISQERITSELAGILAEPDPELQLKTMVDLGVMATILGKWFQLPFHWQKSEYWPNDSELLLAERLAQLIRPNLSAKDIISFGRFFKIANRITRKIQAIRLPDYYEIPEQPSDQATLMTWLDKLDGLIRPEDILPLLTYYLSKYKGFSPLWQRLIELESTKSQLRRSSPPLNGHEIQREFNIEAGAQLGLLLAQVKSGYRNELFVDKAGAIDFLRSIVPL